MSAARKFPLRPDFTFLERKNVMAIVETKVFKYPAEDECLVRRLGASVIAIWAGLPPDVQQKILAECRLVWDREIHVSHLPDKLESIIKRGRN